MAVVVVDAEEGAGEGHHLSVGYKDTGESLARWGSEEGNAGEGEGDQWR